MNDPLDSVKAYFTARITEHGTAPRGVDWNSAEAQELRFKQLLRVRDSDNPFSIVDWGCGYGALHDYIQRQGLAHDYVGFDITPAVLEQARTAHAGAKNARFVGRIEDVPKSDYVIACGVYNIKLDATYEAWTTFAQEQMRSMFDHCEGAIAVNFLTSYSDPPKQRADLFYADPLGMFDFAKRSLSPHVALLHDYGHWDFTLIVRRTSL